MKEMSFGKFKSANWGQSDITYAKSVSEFLCDDSNTGFEHMMSSSMAAFNVHTQG